MKVLGADLRTSVTLTTPILNLKMGSFSIGLVVNLYYTSITFSVQFPLKVVILKKTLFASS